MRTALAAGCLTLLFCAPAAAQLCVEAIEEGSVPLRGTVGYTAAFGAFEKVAQTYGAASMLEKRLLPGLMNMQEDGFTIALDSQSIVGALSMPVCGAERGDPPQLGSMDFGTGGLGFGYKYGWASLFYAGNATYRSVRPDLGWARGALTFGLPIMASFGSPIAPLYHRYDGEAMTLSFDFIAGAEVGNSVVSAGAGYVGSRGLYAHVQSPVSGLFSSAVFGSDWRLPVARVGIETPAWLMGDVGKIIGLTRLYARRLEYNAAPPASLAKRDLGNARTGGYEFTTVHFEQIAIGEKLDLMASMSLEPRQEVYDASIGWRGDFTRVSAGVVKQPVLFAFGAPGGLLPRVTADVDIAGVFMMGVALNAADIVSVLPYARNVVSFHLRIAGTPDAAVRGP